MEHQRQYPGGGNKGILPWKIIGKIEVLGNGISGID